MHIPMTFTSICFAISMSAASTPADTRYAQLRLYGQSGCFRQNYGEMGIYGDHVNVCHNFGDLTVRSVGLEYSTDNCTGEPSIQNISMSYFNERSVYL